MAILVNPQSELIREPNLLVPGKKPVGDVKIDRSTHLGRHCQHFVIPNYSYDIAKRQPLIFGSGITKHVSDSYNTGRFVLGDGSNDAFVTLPNSTGKTYEELTVIGTWGRYDSDIEGIFGNYSGGAGDILIRNDTGRFYLINDASSLGGPSDLDSGLVTAYILHNLAFTYDGSTLRSYEDGSVGTTTGSHSGSSTINAARPLRIGYGFSLSQRGMYGACGYCCVFDIDLSAGLIRDFHRDPYQFLIPA